MKVGLIMAYLECYNLYKKWETSTIDVSFCIEQKTLTSIIGPSGAGKSTVLKMIAGLLPIDKKEIVEHKTAIILDGKNITLLPPAKRNCGMVFQNNSLFLNMTVEQNICYGLKCKGIKKQECLKKSNEMLQLFNLENFAKRYPETLSGGEAQRVALARTLVVEPKLILFDEPLSALDQELRNRLASEIRSMQQNIGFTAIMVTHDIAEAEKISDRIIRIEKGRITNISTIRN